MGQLKGLPVEDGFRMPGEYEPHIGCFMIWPERPDNWRLGGKPAQQNYKEVAVAISNFEPVTMFVSPNQYKNARKELPDTIRVIEMSNDDAWIRDYGPSFWWTIREICAALTGGLMLGVVFLMVYIFRGIKIIKLQKVCELERIDYYSQKDFILEGCSIHVDGEGTLVTTEECLLSEGRNPNLTKIEIEQTLKIFPCTKSNLA